MNSSTLLFNKRILDKKLKNVNISVIYDYTAKHSLVQKWKESIDVGDLRRTNETAIQGLFLSQIFGKVLDYPTVIDGSEYNQIQELKSKHDSTEADGALGFFTSYNKDVRVVIELKDANCDLDKKQSRSNHLTPVEQAFSYSYKNGSACVWVIVSNFKEIRLYKSSSSLAYEQFFVTELDDQDNFKRFYYLLCKSNLICKDSKSSIDILYTETEQADNEISEQFYKDYTDLRGKLFTALKANNQSYDEMTLFSKAQKILDRFIFICFCEDKELLPQNIFKQIIQTAENSFAFTPNRVWSQLNGLFHAIDVGNPKMRINHYNGGLFKADDVLDKLIVPDEVLVKFEKLAECDFESDLNVNILGHIFEHSIADIEQIKAGINGEPINKEQSAQKTGGIYYTPDYVTKYIIDKTIGRWMADAKAEMQKNIIGREGYTTTIERLATGERKRTIILKSWKEIPDEGEVDKYEREAIIKLHIAFWKEYSERLKTLRVLDPACGSGAFLNAAFAFILAEVTYVNETLNSLREGQVTLFDIDKMILENNVCGVDINAESVEITKLSLWLQTANKGKTLATLEHTIKVGNSLVSDPELAGDLAFDWDSEFSDIMGKGGFDVVVGNPPYGAKLSQADKEYIAANYETTEYNFDTYKSFMELGLKLTKQNGYLGYITPNTYFVLEKGANKLRKFLFDNSILMNIVEIFNVFQTAVVEPAISVFKKTAPFADYPLEVVSVPRKTTLSSTFLNDGVLSMFKQSDLKVQEGYIFNFRDTEINKTLRNKISAISKPLSEYFKVTTGVKPYQTGKGIPKQSKEVVESKPFTGNIKVDSTWIPYIEGKMIGRFFCGWDSAFIKYGKWLAEPRNLEMFSNPKLFIRQTGDYPIATFDDTGKVGKNTIHCIYSKEDKQEISLKYALGLINSKLMRWVFQHDNFHIVGKPLAETKKVYVERLPIAVSNNQDEIVELVDKLLENRTSYFFKSNHFSKYIMSMYHPKNMTVKLFTFFKLSYSEFIAELKAQKVNLTAVQKMDLLNLFEEKKKELVILSLTIQNIEDDLDNKVYRLFQLDKADIEVIGKH